MDAIPAFGDVHPTPTYLDVPSFFDDGGDVDRPTRVLHPNPQPDVPPPKSQSPSSAPSDLPPLPPSPEPSLPQTPRVGSSQLPLQPDDTLSDSDDNYLYATPIGPAPPSTPPSRHPPPSPPHIRRGDRIRKVPGEWWKVKHNAKMAVADDFQEVEFAGSVSGPDPRTYKAAMKAPDAEKWKEACDTEVMNLIANGTWELVELPPGAKVVDSGWVFKVKLHADGSLERHRSRIVAKGYSQRPGYDYTEVFAPTFRPASLRLIFALAAREGYKLRSLDISSAFTYGELDEVIYMRQPEGYHQGGPNVVCRLHKSLYGLKQSARQWNKKLRSVLEDLGFERVQSDNSIFIYSKGDVKIIVPVFIDDITLVSKNDAAMDRTVKDLQKHFKLRDLGDTSFLLSVQVKQDLDAHTISLSQTHYIDELLKRFGMNDCNPVRSPLEPGSNLSGIVPTPSEVEDMRKVPYLSAVGSLQYLATMTRPDIAFAVSYLGRFNHNPAPAHWTAVKHLLRYLKGTRDYKLVYKGNDDKELFVTYSDASHGGCHDTGRSTGGYVTLVCGGAVGWSSKRQPFVTLSSTEAEYVAAVEAGKEIMWMRNILSEFGYPSDYASTLFIDNKSGIDVAKNPEHHGRMKHLDLRFYWLRDAVQSSLIFPVYVPTKQQVADIFTKPVSIQTIDFAVPLMGLSA
ncbi:hypothetical protein NP233_g13104 [Leucocoprinus birnbaumii]|uniref:Reverse transcriptase Ty1/copia-type domain-containing protein n=1 Tax=Leucocoprinus birnbaumii TaxID=56174 RepID=A0AAD5VDA0_9AGAR|nr:hypothetical protein NP233_g13104 [Leucocoprinus birnbaumii]